MVNNEFEKYNTNCNNNTCKGTRRYKRYIK